MIPKTIHYCWFGTNNKKQLVQRCIKSWKKYCPDYEIIEWNENNIDVYMNNYTKIAYEQKKWAFLTDYLRLYIVYNHGGIYLDTDVEMLKCFDDLLDEDYFLGFESEKFINTGLGFGAVKKNRIIKCLLDEYEDMFLRDNKPNIEFIPSPILSTKAINKLIGPISLSDRSWIEYENGRIYSQEYFCPKDFGTKEINITEKTHSIHHYDGSWLSPYTKVKESIRGLFRRLKKNI